MFNTRWKDTTASSQLESVAGGRRACRGETLVLSSQLKRKGAFGHERGGRMGPRVREPLSALHASTIAAEGPLVGVTPSLNSPPQLKDPHGARPEIVNVLGSQPARWRSCSLTEPPRPHQRPGADLGSSTSILFHSGFFFFSFCF